MEAVVAILASLGILAFPAILLFLIFRKKNLNRTKGVAVSDLPLNIHPAAIRVSADFTPWGVGGATGGRRSWSGLRSRSPVELRFAA